MIDEVLDPLVLTVPSKAGEGEKTVAVLFSHAAPVATKDAVRALAHSHFRCNACASRAKAFACLSDTRHRLPPFPR